MTLLSPMIELRIVLALAETIEPVKESIGFILKHSI